MFSDESCRENQNTHFVFNEPPSAQKIMPFTSCKKGGQKNNWWRKVEGKNITEKNGRSS